MVDFNTPTKRFIEEMLWLSDQNEKNNSPPKNNRYLICSNL
jgi:hypothetical protein